jgi:hypothetical protein
MKTMTTEAQVLIFLNDGETYSEAGGDAAVLVGDWDDIPEEMQVWHNEQDDDDEHKAFQSGIREVLFLNSEILAKIHEKMPELFLKWEKKAA